MLQARWWSAFLWGAISGLGFAPIFLWPALILGLGWWYAYVVKASTARRSFQLGWWFGWGHFICGLHWIARALWIDIEKFWPLVPLAVKLIPAALAVFPALVGWVAWHLRKRWPAPDLVWIPLVGLLWLGSELFRGKIFPLFPWNLLGYAWGAFDVLLQPAALVGIYGLGLYHFMALAVGWGIYHRKRSHKQETYIYVSLYTIILLANVAYGVYRLYLHEASVASGPVIRLVQPNVSQIDKWNPQRLWLNLETHIVNSGGKPVDVVIWPETAVPGVMLQNLAYRELLKLVVPPQGLLILGVPYKDPDGVHNSLLVMGVHGEIMACYHKCRLVPFGEYVPCRSLLEKLQLRVRKLTQGVTDFTPGPGPSVVHVPGLPPFQPLVCYEVIFPEFRVPASSPEFPQWIVNLTNDGWYGETSGPYQHFLAARLRSIEQGLPLVRAANTGISAVIDAYGRVCSFQPLGVEGVIELVLPLHNIKTVYREWGDWILLLQIFVMCSIIFMPQRRKCFGGNQDLKN